MRIYQEKNDRLIELSSKYDKKEFSDEKYMQTTIEKNIDILFPGVNC